MDFFDNRKGIKQLERIAKEYQVLPETIVDRWKEDYNILYLDQIIRQVLKQKAKRVDLLERQKADLVRELASCKKRVASISLQKQLASIEEQIETIKNAPKLYEAEAKDYLDLYKKMRFTIYGPDRRSLIELYLDMVQKFYPHRIVRDLGDIVDDKCPEHEVKLIPMQDCDEDFPDDRSYCPVCYKVFEGCFDWNKAIVSNPKKEYDLVGNFEKILDQFEGNIIIDIPPILFKELDAKVAEKKWKKKDLSKADVRTLLRETGNSDLYPHVSFIAHRYCGLPRPDLSAYRVDLLNDYREYCKIYDSLEKDRDSAVNGLFVAWKLLEKRGYEGDLEDFKPSISKPTLISYDKIWSQACEKFGWKFIPTV